MPRQQLSLWAASIALAGSLCACTVRDDSTRANQLTGLRILAIGSIPADVVAGESVVVSALVFDEASRAIDYQWSWCLSRGSSEEGYACLLSEQELQAAWLELGTNTELPGYNLGTDGTANLDVVFSQEQALRICEIISRDAPEPQQALFDCASSLGLTFELRVRAGDDQIVAIKDVPVLAEGDARNQNPELGPNLERRIGDQSPLLEDAPLQIDTRYKLVADIDQSQSQTFLPKQQIGLPEPEPRGESLFLSWFVTIGSTHRDGEQRTSYFDTGSISSLTDNTWNMPLTLEASEARLFLVLRDERGGTSWREHRFPLVEMP